MEQFFTDLFARIIEIPPGWAYLVILVVTYVENVAPPIPGDLVVVIGGYLVGVGTLDFVLVVLLSTLGGLAGFMTMVVLGERLGNSRLASGRLGWLPKQHIAKVQAWLLRWGYVVIAANRFLSGARSVISLAVGMAGMAKGPTACYALASALAWTFLITLLGYYVGGNWEIVADYLRQYGRVVFGLILFVLAVQAWRAYRKFGWGKGERQL